MGNLWRDSRQSSNRLEGAVLSLPSASFPGRGRVLEWRRQSVNVDVSNVKSGPGVRGTRSKMSAWPLVFSPEAAKRVVRQT